MVIFGQIGTGSRDLFFILVSFVVFACFLHYFFNVANISSIEVQPWGFAPLQPVRVYLWKEYVPPGASPWPVQFVH